MDLQQENETLKQVINEMASLVIQANKLLDQASELIVKNKRSEPTLADLHVRDKFAGID